MKKSILILAACLAALSLSACSGNGGPSASAQYNSLNEMLKADYSEIDITVSDTFDTDIFLKSEYKINFSADETTVSYTVEKFLPAGDTLDGPIDLDKTVLKGEAVIKDGVIVSVDGDDVNLSADIAVTGMSFKPGYFKNAEITGMTLRADVKDPSGFLGYELTCSGMRIEADFLDAFYFIDITYTSEIGSQVEYRYDFTL